MACIISFYVPTSYQQGKKKSPEADRGKLIVFTRIPKKKSA
jgi:hypothetical protein